MLRASTDDREMAQGCGIKFPMVSMGAFALGGGLGALAGLVGAAYLSIYPGIGFEVLPYALAAVIIGGAGSLRGVVLASAILGLIDNFGKVLLSQLSYSPVRAHGHYLGGPANGFLGNAIDAHPAAQR